MDIYTSTKYRFPLSTIKKVFITILLFFREKEAMQHRIYINNDDAFEITDISIMIVFST